MSTRAIKIRLAWERGEGVRAPELAATWCSLGVDVGDDSATLLIDRRNDAIRREIRTSAYPLAMWIAEHWYALTEHQRASSTDPYALQWTGRIRPQWLPWHNVRGAGDGMPWPDLTLVPEGALTRLVWFKGPGLAGQPVTFLTSGNVFVPTTDLRAELTELVESVLARLNSAGVGETPLHEEWRSLADLDEEERSFARACARLGLDPFAVEDPLADQVVALEQSVGAELLDDFLDSADPHDLAASTRWVAEASEALRGAKPVEFDVGAFAIDDRRPWFAGYEAARALRTRLGYSVEDPVPLEDLVGVSTLDEQARGLRGVAGRVEEGVGVVLPRHNGGQLATRFSQAWALGLVTLGNRRLHLLDPSHRSLPRASRAFAAELLAPAEGIARHLERSPDPGERAFELIADHYRTNSTLIEHQFQNLIAAARH